MADRGYVERQGDITRHSFLDNDGRMHENVIQDVEKYLRFSKELRDNQPQHGPKYSKTLTMVSCIPQAFALKMFHGQCCSHFGKKRTGVNYNIWSPDRDEYMRALAHVQSAHKDLLTMTGRPIGKRRAWQ